MPEFTPKARAQAAVRKAVAALHKALSAIDGVTTFEGLIDVAMVDGESFRVSFVMDDSE